MVVFLCFSLADGVICSSLQIKLPQGSVKRRGSERRRLSGKRASVPGELHCYCWCHLQHVHKSQRRAGLHRLITRDTTGLEAQERPTSVSCPASLSGVGLVQYFKGFSNEIVLFFSFQCDIYWFDYALLNINAVYLVLKLCIRFLFLYIISSNCRIVATTVQLFLFYRIMWLCGLLLCLWHKEHNTVNIVITGYVEIAVNISDSDVLCLLRPGVTSTVNLGAAVPF